MQKLAKQLPSVTGSSEEGVLGLQTDVDDAVNDVAMVVSCELLWSDLCMGVTRAKQVSLAVVIPYFLFFSSPPPPHPGWSHTHREYSEKMRNVAQIRSVRSVRFAFLPRPSSTTADIDIVGSCGTRSWQKREKQVLLTFLWPRGHSPGERRTQGRHGRDRGQRAEDPSGVEISR